EMDIQEKDKNKSQNDKTEHETGKGVKEKSKSNQVKVNLGETDIQQKDEKSNKNRQNRAQNGKVWRSQSQIEAKTKKSKPKSTKVKVKVNPEKSSVKTGAAARKKSIGRERAKDKQEQESSKRQRVEDDKEEEVLKKCFELAKEEDIAINATPLATKGPVVGLNQGAVVRLLDPKLKTLGERGIECIFVGYTEHSKDFRAVVRLPDLKLKTLSERGIEFIFVGYAEHSKAFRIDSHKSLDQVRGTRDEVSDQHTYFFNIEDDPKTFDEAIKSLDVALWKEEINDKMDSIIGNNTWVLADLPPSCKPLGCKWIFKRKLKVDGTVKKLKASKFDKSGKRVIICLYVDDMLIFGTDQVQVDLTKEFLSLRFFMKDMGEVDVILGIKIKHESNGIATSQSYYIEKVLKKFNYFDCTLVRTPMDTNEKLMPNKGQVVSQLEYSRVISCLMYAMNCTKPDIAFVVGKLRRYTSNPGTQH
ncbi:zinc finger, CCHC-type containing protein, partial [Tanacetum coccineum]